jgi:stage II sporulation protein D
MIASPPPAPTPRRAALARALAPVMTLACLALVGCGDGERIPLSSIAPPTIRVMLGDEREQATIGIADAWEAFSEDKTPFADRGSNLVTTISAGPTGIVLRGVATGSSLLRMRVHAGGAFTLDAVGWRTAYRGDLLVRRKGTRLQFVNELDVETYVAGVIINEIGDGQAPSAYRAQAVVARTYAYTRIQENPGAAFHVYDSQQSQVYRGVSLPKNGVTTVDELGQRTAETRGVILTWHSEPFPTYYFSTCGGHTTEAGTAALASGGATEPLFGVPCKYCESSKYFRWTENVDVAALTSNLKPWGVRAPITGIDWTKLGRGAWVAEVTITYGPNGAKKVLPGLIRSMCIESATPSPDGTTLVVKGKGWGHGVGMCQVGCQEMARRGFAGDQILRYYYPGAEFTRIY